MQIQLQDNLKIASDEKLTTQIHLESIRYKVEQLF